MTLKSSYLVWLLLALVAGAWPLMLPSAHNNAPAIHAMTDANTHA